MIAMLVLCLFLGVTSTTALVGCKSDTKSKETGKTDPTKTESGKTESKTEPAK
jgi:hypothetical protein